MAGPKHAAENTLPRCGQDSFLVAAGSLGIISLPLGPLPCTRAGSQRATGSMLALPATGLSAFTIRRRCPWSIRAERSQPALDTLPIPDHISCMVEQEKKFKFLWAYPNPDVERGNEPPTNILTPWGATKEAKRKEGVAANSPVPGLGLIPLLEGLRLASAGGAPAGLSAPSEGVRL